MQQLSDLLGAVTDELLQIRDGQHDPVALDGTKIERSEDKDFIYLETELARNPCTEIDISINQTRVFIRIERAPASHAGDDLEPELKLVFGWVEFMDRGFTLRAILHTDGLWTCEAAPAVAELLNCDYSPAGEPSDDSWGRKELIDAARRFNGLAYLGPGRPAPE
jgi:hypothetical protein